MKRRLIPLAAFVLAAVLTHLAGRILLSVMPGSSAAARAIASLSHPTPEPPAEESTGSDSPAPRRSKAPRPTAVSTASHEAFLQHLAEVKKFMGSDLALDDQGRLTPAIVDLAGLSASQVDKAQQIIDAAWDRMAKSLRSRMTVDSPSDAPLPSDQARFPPQVRKFHIAADPSFGAQVMEELRRDLTSAVGADGMEAIVSMLSPEACFGGMGQYEIDGRLVSGSDPQRPLLTIHWSYLDPATGQALQSFGSYDGVVRKYYGRLFDEWAP